MSGRRRERVVRWRCPHPHKAAYDDQILAQHALPRMRQRALAEDRKPPVRVYQCRCGAWHLTSQQEATDA